MFKFWSKFQVQILFTVLLKSCKSDQDWTSDAYGQKFWQNPTIL